MTVKFRRRPSGGHYVETDGTRVGWVVRSADGWAGYRAGDGYGGSRQLVFGEATRGDAAAALVAYRHR